MQENVEEKHPLLVSLYIDDGRRDAKMSRTIFIEKGRSRGIISGATAVFTEWPSHLTTCWLVTLLTGLAIVFLVLLGAATRPIQQNVSPTCKSHTKETKNNTVFLLKDCEDLHQVELEAVEKILDNFPTFQIQLTYLLRIGCRQEDSRRSTLLGSEVTRAGVSPIRPVNSHQYVKRNKRDLNHSRNSKYRTHFFDWYDDMDINIGSKKLLSLLLKKRFDNFGKNKTGIGLVVTGGQVVTERQVVTGRQIVTGGQVATGGQVVTRKGQMETRGQTVTAPENVPTQKIRCMGELMSKYGPSRIKSKRMLYKDYFRDSPLSTAYLALNPDTLNFAARVLKIWDFSGVTFQLPKLMQDGINVRNADELKRRKKTSPKKQETNQEVNAKINDLIEVGFSSYQNLPEGVVTVDDEGLHLETKTSCHAFFGEIIASLRKANKRTSVSSIIKKTLKSFCMKSAVDNAYCDTQES